MSCDGAQRGLRFRNGTYPTDPLRPVLDAEQSRLPPAKEPHHLDIAAGLAFEPPARLHPVEIAIDVELQENRGMLDRVARSPRARHLRTPARQDRANQQMHQLHIEPGYPGRSNRPGIPEKAWSGHVQHPRQSASCCAPPHTLRESHHESRIKNVFTQPGSISEVLRLLRLRRLSPRKRSHGCSSAYSRARAAISAGLTSPRAIIGENAVIRCRRFQWIDIVWQRKHDFGGTNNGLDSERLICRLPFVRAACGNASAHPVTGSIYFE